MASFLSTCARERSTPSGVLRSLEAPPFASRLGVLTREGAVCISLFYFPHPVRRIQFAYPARRSTSSLVRRRACESSRPRAKFWKHGYGMSKAPSPTGLFEFLDSRPLLCYTETNSHERRWECAKANKKYNYKRFYRKGTSLL